jgi:hypothetical protein
VLRSDPCVPSVSRRDFQPAAIAIRHLVCERRLKAAMDCVEHRLSMGCDRSGESRQRRLYPVEKRRMVEHTLAQERRWRSSVGHGVNPNLLFL